ncbi:MAG: methylated-DNA--[protein]-cysteine S-methyltransferase [Smithella sp.]
MSIIPLQQTNKKIIRHTPIGSVGIIWSEINKHPLIIHVLLSRPGLSAEKQADNIFAHARNSSCAEIDAIADSIRAYLEGANVKFSLDVLDLSPYTQFQKSVLRAQHAIPRGSVSTYGLIAAHVGASGGARAVGNVMACNPFPLIIPCHRTILSNLHLGGFQSGADIKRALLERDGIIFDEQGRVICKRLHYAPA